MPPTSTRPASNRPAALLAGLLLGCLLLQGCSQWRYQLGTPLTESQTPDPADALSLAVVLEALGPPMRISATADGYVMAWEHWRVREDTLGISLGRLTGTDLLSVDWGDARMQGEFILALFSRDHRLTASAFSDWDSDAGGGTALQPFIGVALVDVDDLIARLPHHRWGASLLDRLPEALNAPNRPDTGQSGIQQRGTSPGIGQQTLEMD